jgi:tetratricopeptide (TPR) repeat protein
MEWALETDAMAAMQLGEALGFYLARYAYANEGLPWLNDAAARGRESIAARDMPDRPYTLALARVLTARAMFDFGLASSGPEARAAGEEATGLARQTGDQRVLARALAAWGMTSAFWGDPAGARPIGEEALALAQALPDPQAIDLSLNVLELSDQAQHSNPARLLPRMAEALRLARELGNPWNEAMATLNVARAAGWTGDLDTARTRYTEAMRLFAELGDTTQINGARSDLAHALRRAGQVDEAAALYAQTLRDWQHMGARGAVAHQLESLASLALTRREAARAAHLLGAAESLRAASGAVHMGMEREEYAQLVAELRAQLPEAEVEAAWATGGTLGMDEAVAYALGESA